MRRGGADGAAPSASPETLRSPYIPITGGVRRPSDTRTIRTGDGRRSEMRITARWTIGLVAGGVLLGSVASVAAQEGSPPPKERREEPGMQGRPERQQPAR